VIGTGVQVLVELLITLFLILSRPKLNMMNFIEALDGKYVIGTGQIL